LRPQKAGRKLSPKFEALNRVKLSDAEFARLHDEIVNLDVFIASKNLRQRTTFYREDGTPLQILWLVSRTVARRNALWLLLLKKRCVCRDFVTDR
jgi:hypothetical protein